MSNNIKDHSVKLNCNQTLTINLKEEEFINFVLFETKEFGWAHNECNMTISLNNSIKIKAVMNVTSNGFVVAYNNTLHNMKLANNEGDFDNKFLFKIKLNVPVRTNKIELFTNKIIEITGLQLFYIN